jgi:hypothetical protein
MSELYDPRAWEDDDEPPSRAVWHDAEPDTRERGPKRPAPRGGYRIRSDETWARARDAYLAGETAEEVAFRFDLTLGSLRHRARIENWRRADQDDPDHEHRVDDPRLDNRWGHIGDDEGYADLAERALSQLRRAMAQGRAGAAASWMRVHDRLTARAEVDEARKKKAEDTARRAAERAAAEVRAVAAARADVADGLARDVTRLALGAAALLPDNAVARAALDAELARLERTSGALDAAAISHDSDGSHPADPPPDDP